MQKIQRLFVAALFSSIIFVTNFFVPPPIRHMLVVVQAVMLALATFFVGKAGATYVGLIGGVLSALAQPAFGPFTFLFTLLFGLLVDAFAFVFKAFPAKDGVNRNRVMLAMAFSTAMIGFLSYYVFTASPTLVPFDPVMSGLVIFVGIGSGLSAGYAAAYLWNKYLKSLQI